MARKYVRSSPAVIRRSISAEVQSSRLTSTGPIGVGTEWEDTVKFMGRTSRIPTVITEYELGRKISYRHLDGPIKAELTYVLTPDDGRTRLDIMIDAELPWYFRVLTPVLRGQLGRQMDANFSALKGLLEGPDTNKP